MAQILIALVFIVGLSGAAGGYQIGKHKTTAEFLTLQNSDLRESRKETQRQIAHVSKAQKEYHAQLETIADFAVRLRVADRLRIQAEHAAAVERASAESLRFYAKGLHGLYSECREAYGELAVEGAKAAASAEALR